MAFLHCDLNIASAGTSPYETWAKASDDIFALSAASAEGDTIYVQGESGSIDPTSGAIKDLVGSGALDSPVKIIGVKHGTTNEAGSVVASDLIAGQRANGDAVLTTNPYFTADSGWTKGTGWTIASNKASCDGTQGGDSDLEQNQTITNGVVYEILYEISGYSAGTLTPVIGGTSGTARSANGVYREVIAAGAGADPKLELRGNSTFVGDVNFVEVRWARAYDQPDAPRILNTGTGSSIRYNKALYFYGVVLKAGTGDMQHNGDGSYIFEEVHFTFDNIFSDLLVCGRSSGSSITTKSIRCKLDGSNQKNFPSDSEYFLTTTDRNPATGEVFLANNSGGELFHYGLDLVEHDSSGGIFSGSGQAPDCGYFRAVSYRVTSGLDITNSAPTRQGRILSSGGGVNLAVPLGSGASFQHNSLEVWNGDVTLETTAIRTGGANDGASGGFSMAMTPDSGETTKGFESLRSEWIEGWIDGDGTNKTLTVFIANSGAGDYDDTQVWLEVLYPSEIGTPLGEYRNTLPGLLVAASTITDDSVSSWAGSAANGQKIQLTIAPALSGPIQVRVHFAPENTETLFFDPKLDIA